MFSDSNKIKTKKQQEQKRKKKQMKLNEDWMLCVQWSSL